MEVYGFIIAGLALMIYVLQTYLHHKRLDDLLNRVMAKSYEQFQYYDKIVPEEVEEVKKLRAEAREIRSGEDEEAKKQDEEYAEEIEQLRDFEEQWSGEEVDLQKLREMNKEG